MYNMDVSPRVSQPLGCDPAWGHLMCGQGQVDFFDFLFKSIQFYLHTAES